MRNGYQIDPSVVCLQEIVERFANLDRSQTNSISSRHYLTLPALAETGVVADDPGCLQR